jgi:hypothetical protein
MRASNRTNVGVIAALLAVGLVCMVQPAFGGRIVSWGVSQAIDGNDYIAIAGGYEHSLAIMTCPYKLVGDWDGDCKVDFYDIALTTSNWLVDCYQTPEDPACTPR